MLDGCVPWPEEFVALYEKKGYWEGLTLGEAFDGWVGRYADRVAVEYQGRQVTYEQMGAYATRLAYHMTELGIETYDRIIMQLPNVPELVYLIYACMKIGVIPICSLQFHRWAEISYLAQLSEARIHAIPGGEQPDFDYEAFAQEVSKATPSMAVTLATGTPRKPGIHSINELMEKEVDLAKAEAVLRGYRPDPTEPAFFQLSGGTTGVPKIIPRTHNDYHYNLKCNAAAIGEGMEGVDTKTLLLMPLMHNATLVCGLLPVHCMGGSVVFSPSLAPEAILQTISDSKATHTGLVAVFMKRFLDLPREVLDRYDTSSLERFVGLWNPEDADVYGFMELFGCDGIQVYGMAEGLICFSRWSDPPEIRHKTDGRPVSEADEVRIVDPDTEEDVPVGQEGECWCRGPYTVRGYYRAPERNAEAFTPDGFYRTGDLVRMDGGGNITWMGRIKDCIDRGAEKINAEEVEGHIARYPKVYRVAVVGMPDKYLGERVCAFIVPMPGETFTLEELNEFLLSEENIAKFKVPERLEFLDELPVTRVGKLEKKSLREKIARMLKEEGAL